MFFSRKFKKCKIHFVPLVLAALKCYCGDNRQNADHFQDTCFKERINMKIAPNLWVTLSLYKEYFFSVITWNKKHSLKASFVNAIHACEVL